MTRAAARLRRMDRARNPRLSGGLDGEPAVISAPIGTAASTTQRRARRPAMMRLRMGKFACSGACRSRTRCEDALAAMRLVSGLCRAGYPGRARCRRPDVPARAERSRVGCAVYAERSPSDCPAAPRDGRRTPSRSRAPAASGCGCRRSRSAPQRATRFGRAHGARAAGRRSRAARADSENRRARRRRASPALPGHRRFRASARSHRASPHTARVVRRAPAPRRARRPRRAPRPRRRSRFRRAEGPAAGAPRHADAGRLDEPQPAASSSRSITGERVAAYERDEPVSRRVAERPARRDRVLHRQMSGTHAVETRKRTEALTLVGELERVPKNRGRSSRGRTGKRARAAPIRDDALLIETI